MGEIKIFESPLFGQVRTTLSASGEPQFCLKDLCDVLGLTAKGVSQRLSKEVISNYPLVTAGGTQMFSFVNEDGMYDVILDSRKPEAKVFRKWVTSVVLPSLRKTGTYSIAQLSRKELAMMVIQSEEERERLEIENKEVKAKNEQQAERIELQSEELKKQAPKVAYHDEVLTSTSTYNTTNIAKEFGMGAPTLNKILHEKGIQYKMDGQWLLYHKYQGLGYTRTVTNTYDNGYGEVHTRQQTVWTERGRQFIHQVMKADLLAKAN